MDGITHTSSLFFLGPSVVERGVGCRNLAFSPKRGAPIVTRVVCSVKRRYMFECACGLLRARVACAVV